MFRLVLCLVVFVCLVACVCLPLLDSMCIQPLLAASLPRLLLLLLWGLMGPAYNSLSPGQFFFPSFQEVRFFFPGQTRLHRLFLLVSRLHSCASSALTFFQTRPKNYNTIGSYMPPQNIHISLHILQKPSSNTNLLIDGL